MLSINTDYELVTNQRQLRQWQRRLEKAKSFCCDTETTGLDAMAVELVGVALSVEEGDEIVSCYIPVGHRARLGRQLDLHDVLNAVRFEIYHKPTVWHNALYDMLVLGQDRYGVEFGNVHDSMFMAYALYGDQLPSLGMDYLAERFMGFKTIKFSDVVLNRPGRQDFRDVPLEEATEYAAEDTAITFALAKLFQRALKDQGLFEVYTRDRALLPVLYSMKRNGVAVDLKLLAELEDTWAGECADLVEKMFAAAGTHFNPGSSPQVLEVLEGRGLRIPFDKKTGKQSVDKHALEMLAGDEVVDLLREYRGKSKLLSTYARALPTKVRADTGRVHGNFPMTRTATGRAASNDPNLQNIPTRTKDGEKLRSAFVAEPGKLLVCADYSQIEYRVLAHVSKQPELIEAFHNGIDVHAQTMATIRGIPVDQVSKSERSVGKTVNFAAIYGAGPGRVAQTAGIELAEAYVLLDDYWQALPKVLDWKAETLEFAKKHGYVETMFGRRIHLKHILSRDSELRSYHERLAINAPIQGSAADLMRFAMVDVHKRAPAKLLLTVHDELVLEAQKDVAEDVKGIVEHCMIHAADDLVDWLVPIEVEAKIGRTWKDAK